MGVGWGVWGRVDVGSPFPPSLTQHLPLEIFRQVSTQRGALRQGQEARVEIVDDALCVLFFLVL